MRIFTVIKRLIGCFSIILYVLLFWFLFGFLLNMCNSEEKPEVASDLEMAKTFIEDNPEFRKAKIKQLKNGTIKIIAKHQTLKLKDGVIMSAN